MKHNNWLYCMIVGLLIIPIIPVSGNTQGYLNTDYIDYDSSDFKCAEYFFDEETTYYSIIYDDSGRGSNGDTYGGWGIQHTVDGRYHNSNAINLNNNKRVNIYNPSEFNYYNTDSYCIYANIRIPEANQEGYNIACHVDYTYYGGEYTSYKGWAFIINQDGYLEYRVYDYDSSVDSTFIDFVISDTTTYLLDDQWHFVAVTYNDNYYSLYVDPNMYSDGLVKSEKSYIRAADNNEWTYIGFWRSYPYVNYFMFHGYIDDIHFMSLGYDIPWGNGKNGYWTFDENQYEENYEFINDRATWNYENRGNLINAGFSTNKVYGESSLNIQNYDYDPNNQDTWDPSYGEIQDYQNTLDLNTRDYYIDLWFSYNGEKISEQTLLYKKDTMPITNGYHVYIDPKGYDGGNNLRADFGFTVWNNYNEIGYETDSEFLIENHWYHLVIKFESDKRSIKITDTAGAPLLSILDDNLYHPLATVSNLYIGNKNPYHFIPEENPGLDGNIDEMKIGVIIPDHIYIPFHDIEDTRYEMNTGSDYTSPKSIGNSPWGLTYEFNGEMDQAEVLLYPYQNIMYETFEIQINIFPFRTEVVDRTDETYDPTEEMLIVEHDFWKIFINEDDMICIQTMSRVDATTISYMTTCSVNPVQYFQWNSINVKFSHMDIYLYVNGKLESTNTIQTGNPYYFFTSPFSHSNIYFGNGDINNVENCGFHGYIDEFHYHSLILEDPDDLLYNNEEKLNLHLDFDEGNGYLSYDNTNGNNGHLGEYYVDQVDNSESTSENDQKIYNQAGDGFDEPGLSWIDESCTVTIANGEYRGITKDIEDVTTHYVDVGSGNKYPDDILSPTTYYIQKNDPSWINEGIYGRCLDFSNSAFNSEYVTVCHDDGLNFANSVSISFWINPVDTNAGFILGKWNGIPGADYATNQYGQYWVVLNNNKLDFYLCEDNDETGPGTSRIFTSSSTILPGQWQHVQLKLLDEIVYFYINGEYDCSFDSGIENLYQGGSSNLFIGQIKPAIYQNGYNGKIDELKISEDTLDNGIPIQFFNFESITGDLSIFNSDSTNHGVQTNQNGKYGSCAEFDGVDDYILGHSDYHNSFTIETWVNVDQGTNCVASYMYENENDPVNPVLFMIEDDGRLSVRTSNSQRPNSFCYSLGNIQWNTWTHIAISLRVEIKNNELPTNNNHNSIAFYINGKLDSIHYMFEFGQQDPNPSITGSRYLIGKCPSDLWESTNPLQSNYFSGLMDEFVITNGPKNFLSDTDGDNMDDCYEIARSTNSDQYNPYEHNNRIAVLFAPSFSESEYQYIYDITMMRFNFISLGWKDSDIIFISKYYTDENGDPETGQCSWLSGNWIDGDPYEEYLVNAFQGLEIGGPIFLRSLQGEVNEIRYHPITKIKETDTLFVELRDHGVGYKDSPQTNGENNEYDYGWAMGRCKSVPFVSGTTYSDKDEKSTRGDIPEKEFILNMKKFFQGVDTAQLYNGQMVQRNYWDYDADPDFFTDEEIFTSLNGIQINDPQNPSIQIWITRTRFELDMNDNGIDEEIYLVREYDDSNSNYQYTPGGAFSKGSQRFWYRLYVDGYDFNNPGTDMWDAQVLAWEFDLNNQQGEWQSSENILDITGLDLNEDDLITPTSNRWLFGSYSTQLTDDIDIDEGIVCLHEDHPEELENLKEGETSSHLDETAIQFAMPGIIWDDEIESYLENGEFITYKHLILHVDTCFSGGFIQDFKNFASTIMTSNRENDTSYRYNVMFYSRLKGENIASYTVKRIMCDESRTDIIGNNRYGDESIIADGAKNQIINPDTDYLNYQGNDRDIIWDSDTTPILGIKDGIISINEAMIFTNAILAWQNGLGATLNRKIFTNPFFWEHDPEYYMCDGSTTQIFI